MGSCICCLRFDCILVVLLFTSLMWVMVLVCACLCGLCGGCWWICVVSQCCFGFCIGICGGVVLEVRGGCFVGDCWSAGVGCGYFFVGVLIELFWFYLRFGWLIVLVVAVLIVLCRLLIQVLCVCSWLFLLFVVHVGLCDLFGLVYCVLCCLGLWLEVSIGCD